MEPSSLINPQVPVDVLSSKGSRLEAKIRAAQTASGEKQKNELRRVSQEFEAIFIAQLLKVMRQTIEESGLTEGGFGKSIYTELFDQEVSLSISRRGALGISDLLYRSLVEKTIESASPAGAPAPDTPAPSSPAGSMETQTGAENEISDLQLPVQAPVSSAFGARRDPFSGRARFHKGVDLAAPEGMKVAAALAGKVISAGYQRGYGRTVLLQHPGGLQTRYAHLGSIDVKAGDLIALEETLGTVGNTGRSTGPHLHFEVIRMGEPVNPLPDTASLMARQGQLKSGG